MNHVQRIIALAAVASFFAVNMIAQNSQATKNRKDQPGVASVAGNNSIANPGVCDGSGIGNPSGKGNGKAYGAGNGSGNKGSRPLDGTGYGTKNQQPMGSMANTGGFSRGQGTGRQGGGFGNRRNR
jgi:hypothetical protein